MRSSSPRFAASFAVLALVASTALVVACDDEAEPNPLADKPRAFVTYNIGLAAGYVDYSEERRPQVVSVVAGLDADVVCLQEVWSQADVDAVIAGLGDAYPYHHYVMLEDTTVGPPACTEAETDPLVACVGEHCAGVGPGELAGCVIDNCGAEFGALSTGCSGCAVSQLSKPVEEIIEFCTTGDAKYTYDGANGLLMVSRAKLTNTTHLKIDPSTNVQRSVLGANVNLPELGNVAVFCSHVAADLTSEGLVYAGPAGSWEGENRVQTEAVRDHAAANAGGATKIVILGDYNSGPEIPSKAIPELPSAGYKVLIDAGYTAYNPGECTYCEDNLLTSDETKSKWIDHVFTKGFDAAMTSTVTRVGTTTITITSATDGTVETHPSDHYGVRVELDP